MMKPYCRLFETNNKEKFIEEVMTLYNKHKDRHCGLRVEDSSAADYKIVMGATPNNSRVWVDNEVTDDLLDGVSAIDLDMMERFHYSIQKILGLLSYYMGDKILFLTSDNASTGTDDGEIIMEDSKILKVWNFGYRELKKWFEASR